MSDPASDETSEFECLLARARNQDELALGQLLNQYREYLLAIANRDTEQRLRTKFAASDIVQETLLTASQRFETFLGDKEEELVAWLRQIVSNDIKQTARTYRQTQRRDIQRECALGEQPIADVGLSDRLATPGTDAVAKEEEQQLIKAMDTLEKLPRTVVELRSFQQLPFEQVGLQIGKSAEAARKIWERAILQLQAAVKK